jgi:hypothetical protein
MDDLENFSPRTITKHRLHKESFAVVLAAIVFASLLAPLLQVAIESYMYKSKGLNKDNWKHNVLVLIAVIGTLLALFISMKSLNILESDLTNQI